MSCISEPCGLPKHAAIHGYRDNKKGKMPVQYEFQTQKPPLGGYDITTYCFDYSVFLFLVPGAGLEPAQP